MSAVVTWSAANSSVDSCWVFKVFIIYRLKCCVTDCHIVFVCYNKHFGMENINKKGEGGR